MKNNDIESQFPCWFPIKVVVRGDCDFKLKILKIVQKHVPSFDLSNIKTKPSKNGNYVSITANVYAENKKQIDKIYIELNNSNEVIMTL